MQLLISQCASLLIAYLVYLYIIASSRSFCSYSLTLFIPFTNKNSSSAQSGHSYIDNGLGRESYLMMIAQTWRGCAYIEAHYQAVLAGELGKIAEKAKQWTQQESENNRLQIEHFM